MKHRPWTQHLNADGLSKRTNDYRWRDSASLLLIHVTNVASRTTYALAESSRAVLQNAPNNIKQAVFAIRSLRTDLHEHAQAVHGIKDLVLPHNRDIHDLALKKLVNKKTLTRHLSGGCVCFCSKLFQTKLRTTIFEFQRSFRAKLSRSQRLLHERPCMNVMPQLYQNGIFFRAHNAIGHQASAKLSRAYKNATLGLGFVAP